MKTCNVLKNIGMSLALVAGFGPWAHAADGDFSFVQMSDIHWGFNNPKVNPDFAGTLKKAVAAVNRLDPQPDFIIVTGDVTHMTSDPQERLKRMTDATGMLKELKVKNIMFLPGEHDADADGGETFKEVFGKPYYSFDHKGVHFVGLDDANLKGLLGDDELKWMSNDLKNVDKNTRLVVLSHRPLFDFYPQWDWWTKDGARAVELIEPFKNVIVFYGHIHQEDYRKIGHIPHFGAMGLMFPLPAPGTAPKRTPVAWDPEHPYKGLGFRSVQVRAGTRDYVVTEYSINGDILKTTVSNPEAN